MFSVSDLATVCVLEKGFTFLRNNPEHLEYLLCGFMRTQEMIDKIGMHNITEVINYVKENRINVGTVYETDLQSLPMVAVIDSGSEGQQFLGDFGSSLAGVKTLPPIVYVEFDVTAISGDVITVSSSKDMTETLWPGVILTNGQYEFIVEGIIDSKTVCLKEAPAEDTILKGWKAVSSVTSKGYTLNASIDNVKIQCKIATNGDYAIHRLVRLLVRWCFKKFRLEFDRYGLQVATYSWSPPMQSDQTENQYESVATIDAQYTDYWIENIFSTGDPTANHQIKTTAINDSPDKADVDLD